MVPRRAWRSRCARIQSCHHFDIDCFARSGRVPIPKDVDGSGHPVHVRLCGERPIEFQIQCDIDRIGWFGNCVVHRNRYIIPEEQTFALERSDLACHCLRERLGVRHHGTGMQEHDIRCNRIRRRLAFRFRICEALGVVLSVRYRAHGSKKASYKGPGELR